ncbi:MAG: hypothetical protein ACQEP0_06935 [Natrinema limicola]
MGKWIKRLGSLLAGVFGFLAVGIGVTAALEPYIWPSAILGLPAGIIAGVALVPLTYLGLSYWEERTTTGTASPETSRRFWATVAAILGFLGGGGLAMIVLSMQAIGLAAAMLFGGVPVGIGSAVLAAYFASHRNWGRHSKSESVVR